MAKKGAALEQATESTSTKIVPLYSRDKLTVQEVVAEAKKRLAPLWDVRDYVAVNPLFGYRDQPFLHAIEWMEALSGSLLLPNNEYFKKKYELGEILDSDLSFAMMLRQGQEANAEDYDFDRLLDFLKHPDEPSKVHILSLSDLYDSEFNSHQTDWIVREISKWASAYFDEGQALWPMPKDAKGLFATWRNLVVCEDKQSLFHDRVQKLAQELSHDPAKAIQSMCEKLGRAVDLDSTELLHYFLRLLVNIQGWSSFVQKIEFEKGLLGTDNSQEFTQVEDLLAIRLAYDLAFLDQPLAKEKLGVWEPRQSKTRTHADLKALWLVADEVAVRRELAQKLKTPVKDRSERPLAQMAFCIDVRSEVIRRHLEQESEEIQTIGFAGFFGVPFSYKRVGAEKGDHQCPVLIKPALEVTEKLENPEQALLERKKLVLNKYGLKAAQFSSNSSFSIAETFGFAYASKMISNAFGLQKPNISVEHAEEGSQVDVESLPLETKVQMAKGALFNMGLTKGFAKYVIFFGHGGESSNNPYESALDCGACAGHNGKFNSRFLASVLNESSVRQELAKNEIEIPGDTIFLSGWHNTTKDLLLVDRIGLNSPIDENFMKIQSLLSQAGQACRVERAKDLLPNAELGKVDLSDEFHARANDWSEVRPEWALARNHSFIVGRRELTHKVNLEGRSFLHDYDAETDPELKKLELIMTAPMIVTNWINMQYYASTIDPEKFGAGNKTLNNVVGTIGCIQGNGSDLLGGLSEQSVRWQGKYFHEPVRLQVFIEAESESIDQIIDKHPMVEDLVKNGWIHITSISPKNGQLKMRLKNTWIDSKEGLWN